MHVTEYNELKKQGQIKPASPQKQKAVKRAKMEKQAGASTGKVSRKGKIDFKYTREELEDGVIVERWVYLGGIK